jgi:hypothetical protein
LIPLATELQGLILWAGFLGAWLLFAGPVYQAVNELREEDFERERLEEASKSAAPADPLSPWWWLFPPVLIWLNHRRRAKWQDRVVLELPDEDYEALSSFMAKARGWMLVGAGGLLIAVKETFELVEWNEWDDWVFWALVVLMTLLSLGHAAYQSARDGRARELRAAVRGDGAKVE